MDFLALPLEFGADPLWQERSGWAAAYVSMQLRAVTVPTTAHVEPKRQEVQLQPGELLFSLRLAGEWWGMSWREAGDFMHYLERRRLIGYPEGQPTRSYRVRLWEWWGAGQAETAQPRGRPSLQVESPGQAGPVLVPSGAENPAEFVAAQPLQLVPELVPEKPEKNGKRKRAQRAQLVPEGEEEDDLPAGQVQNAMVLLHKIGLHESKLFTGQLWQKQAAVVRRMIQTLGYDTTEAAIRGLRLLYPWNQPDAMPYDAFTVEKHAAKGAAEWSRTHAQRQEKQEKQEEREAVRAAAAARAESYSATVKEWRRRVSAAVRALPEAEQEDLVREAEKEALSVPGLNPENTQKYLRATALRIYGERVGDPPPLPPR